MDGGTLMVTVLWHFYFIFLEKHPFSKETIGGILEYSAMGAIRSYLLGTALNLLRNRNHLSKFSTILGSVISSEAKIVKITLFFYLLL